MVVVTEFAHQEKKVRALMDLFVQTFPTAADMSCFARSLDAVSEIGPDLPGENVPARIMAAELAEQLVRRGLVTREFFQGLAEIRPAHAKLILRRAAGFGWALDPAQLRLTQDRSTIILDPDGSDLITIEVVSRTTGRSCKVAISKHRLAKYAARDIFAVAVLKEDRTLMAVMSRDEYRLCQGGKSFDDEVVGDVIQDGLPVHIERRQRDFVHAFRLFHFHITTT